MNLRPSPSPIGWGTCLAAIGTVGLLCRKLCRKLCRTMPPPTKFPTKFATKGDIELDAKHIPDGRAGVRALLHIGSWFQCGCPSRWKLPMNRLMAHLTPALSPLRGRRGSTALVPIRNALGRCSLSMNLFSLSVESWTLNVFRKLSTFDAQQSCLEFECCPWADCARMKFAMSLALLWTG